MPAFENSMLNYCSTEIRIVAVVQANNLYLANTVQARSKLNDQ